MGFHRGMVVGLLGLAAVCLFAWSDVDPRLREADIPAAVTASSPLPSSRAAASTAVPSSSDTTPAKDTNATVSGKPGLPDLTPVSVSLSEAAKLVATQEALAAGAAYRTAEGEWKGAAQRVHVLTVDPAAVHLQMVPMLSYDRMFGFEILSAMSGRLNALAAVNAGFAYTDGRPAGTVRMAGEWIHPSDSRFPSLLWGGGSVSLMPLETSVQVTVTAAAAQTDIRLMADTLNPWPLPEGISVFTSAYGRTDRAEGAHLAVVVSEGQVRSIVDATAPVEIPEDGFLVVASGRKAIEELRASCNTEDTVGWEILSHPPVPEGSLHALACGSFLVREGVPVEPERDPWVGSLAGRAPRTAVGIGAQGQLVFVVAEGRIPDGPSGLSGNELADLLVAMGLRDAALLDGGASSELLVDGALMNRLSAGRERLLPCGFALIAAD